LSFFRTFEPVTRIEKFRREVYTRGLRAAPFTGAAATAKDPTYYRNRALQPGIFKTVVMWVERELKV
jgi:hypothetical protein